MRSSTPRPSDKKSAATISEVDFTASDVPAEGEASQTNDMGWRLAKAGATHEALKRVVSTSSVCDSKDPEPGDDANHLSSRAP